MAEATTPNIVAGLAAPNSVQNDAALRGLVAEVAPPWGTSSSLAVSQSEIAVKVWLPPGLTKITGSLVNLLTAGSSLTGGQNLLTLYNSAGTKQGSTADQSAIWTTLGTYSADFVGGPFSLPDAFCYVGFLSNGTTPATFRAVTNSAPFYNIGMPGGALAGANLLAGRIGAAVTAPASFSPASLSATGAVPYWIGLY